MGTACEELLVPKKFEILPRKLGDPLSATGADLEILIKVVGSFDGSFFSL